MEIPFFIRGLVIGFSIAAPVGPIGVLCIRRTLADGRASGFFSGLGAATADAVYGCVAAFGLTLISDFLIERQLWLRLIGGLFLCILGVRAFFSRPGQGTAAGRRVTLSAAYASTFLLTVTNPMTILSFAAVFAGIGLTGTKGDGGAAGLLVAGVFSGSGVWWFLLSGGVSLFREKFSNNAMRWINRISGVIITAFGLVALAGLLN